ncbi:MAG: FAD-dependent oxidoreductase [Verrucomicrobiota bacterium]
MPHSQPSGIKKPQKLYEVVILGGGFAGVYCAQAIAKALGSKLRFTRIAIISEENYMVFQPMLPEVAGASLSPRVVINPIRQLCKGAEVFKGHVDSVDFSTKTVRVNVGNFAGITDIRFDHLVLTLGAKVDLSRTPGMSEHAFLMSTVGDAMKLRATTISRLEEANLTFDPEIRKRLLSFVIVGGGYSGVETAGQMIDLLRFACRFYKNISIEECRVSLIHSREALLPTLSEKLGRYTANILTKRGVDVILKQRVKSVTARKVYLGDGRAIESHTVICTIGNAPNPLIASVCQQFGAPMERGRITTGPDCQVSDSTFLWAAGDCANVPFIKGGYCPPTAQFSMRQGALMGKNIVSVMHARDTKPFKFRGFGELASLGHRSAVANVLGQNFSGILAWFFWRTVYLAKLPGFDRKLRVMAEWTLELVCPKDINLLNPRYSPSLSEMLLEEGDVVFNEGEPAFSFYMIQRGCIEIVDADGKVIKSLTQGGHFGERALLADQIWQYTAVAKEETVLIALEKSVLERMIQGCGSFEKMLQHSAKTYVAQAKIESVNKSLPKELLAKTAGEVMRAQVHSLKQSHTLRYALDLIKLESHSTFPVVNENKEFQGVILKEDLYECIKSSNGEDFLDTPISRIEVRKFPSILEGALVPEVVETLLRGGTSKIVVLNNENQLKGILTLIDLMSEEALAEV